MQKLSLCPDNYTKEKIKELRKSLADKHVCLEGVIKASSKFIEQVQDIDRFTSINIEAHKSELLEYQRQLDELKLLDERLRQDNGYELNINNIQEKAFFSVFFLGELLGLSEPEYNKDGNLLLTFLDVLTGWTYSKMSKEATRKRISVSYGKYKRFKLGQNTKPLIEQLLRSHQKQRTNLSSIVEKFTSHLLKLSIKPYEFPITQDA